MLALGIEGRASLARRLGWNLPTGGKANRDFVFKALTPPPPPSPTPTPLHNSDFFFLFAHNFATEQLGLVALTETESVREPFGPSARLLKGGNAFKLWLKSAQATYHTGPERMGRRSLGPPGFSPHAVHLLAVA